MKKFIDLTKTISSSYYPENIYKFYLINTTKGMQATLKLVKKIFPKRTQEKMEILDIEQTNKFELMSKHIEKTSIPKMMGGECECAREKCFERNIGPWNPIGKPFYEGDEWFLWQ